VAEQSGQEIIIELDKEVGSGTQGYVYAAIFDGERHAVKWYYPEWIKKDKRLLERLRRARSAGSPDPSFLWPIDLVTSDRHPGLFGYVMPFCGDRFVSFFKLVEGEVRPSLRVLATAALESAIAFRALHAKGLCYQDISFGNVSLDPETGEVRIFDNDNVDTNNEKKVDLYVTTPGFWAPEVVTRTGRVNKYTDMWSFAVLMFWGAFVKQHPLRGRREQEYDVLDHEAQLVMEGTDPVFIFDPQDLSNRPVPGEHDNALRYWPIYPRFFHDLFTRAFTEGIRDPGTRVMGIEWRNAMVKLRDLIMLCPICNIENFHDPDAGNERRCWSCSEELPTPLCLTFADHQTVMAEGSFLYPHHTNPQQRWDFSAPVAQVLANPDQPQVFGLKNLQSTVWRAAMHGREMSVAPKEVIELQPGMQIAFGHSQAVVGSP
jgi:serine/threonine protein kinase